MRRVTVGVWIVSAGLLLSGTKGCQEDYDLGSAFSPRPTETPTPTPTDEGGGIDETPTPTPTVEGEGSPTPSPSPTEDVGAAFLGALSGVGISNDDGNVGITGAPKPGSGGVAGSAVGENWLGRSYTNDGRAPIDTDNDGYSDDLEKRLGTDGGDEYSQPRPGASVLMNRFRGLDDDYDGLSNQEEARLKSDPTKADTDGDGARDGAEAASSSDPINPNSLPEDGDGDGLSDDYEGGAGTNPRAVDSDNDRLPDSIEIAIGSNPLNPDTDGDGAFDGREYQGGSDPTLKDYAK